MPPRFCMSSHDALPASTRRPLDRDPAHHLGVFTAMHVIRQLHRQHQGALDLPLPHLARERTFEAERLELRELVAPERLSDLRHDLGAFVCVLCRVAVELAATMAAKTKRFILLLLMVGWRGRRERRPIDLTFPTRPLTIRGPRPFRR